MKINSIGIIGGTQGLGARFARYFEQKFPEIEVLVSGRKTQLTNNNIVQRCDLVIFAVPINVTQKVITDCLPAAREDQIWVDFTSIKQQPVAKMLESKAQVCGLHPLFGPMPDIEGQPIIYTPTRIEESFLARLLELFSKFDLVKLTPKQHDDLMGIVQCASHFSDMVMGETLKNSGFDFETIWRVSSPSYRLKLQVMARMFAQNPGLYADIAIDNLSSLEYLEKFNLAAEELKTVVEKKDREDLVLHMERSREYLSEEFCSTAYRDSRVFLASFKNKDLSAQEISKKADLAIFGEPFSHTDQAAQETQRSGLSKNYYPNIFQVYEAVEAGQAEFGILPYENSREGSVFQTLDGLFDYPEIKIVECVERPIVQNLLGISGTEMTEIKTIISHPQALAQSKDFLQKNCPQAQVKNEASTAVAGQIVQSQMDPTLAAIGSEALAKNLGLEIIAQGIEGEDNYTRFIKIAKADIVGDNHHTSFVFWFNGDQSGNLAQVLSRLAENDVNLVKLDSRRAGKEYGHYLFFIDAVITLAEFENIKPELDPLVGGLRVLGSY